MKIKNIDFLGSDKAVTRHCFTIEFQNELLWVTIFEFSIAMREVVIRNSSNVLIGREHPVWKELNARELVAIAEGN